ncbi:MAG: hypothetical protein QM784_26630 [Polyangiaceae bacterium]
MNASMDTLETLLWLCRIPSPTGSEGPIAEELFRRLQGIPALEATKIRRHGNSIVVDSDHRTSWPQDRPRGPYRRRPHGT